MLACLPSPPPPPPTHLHALAPLLLACPGPGSGFNKREGGKNNPCVPLLLPPPHPISPSSKSQNTSSLPPPPIPQIMLLLTERGRSGREIKYGDRSLDRYHTPHEHRYDGRSRAFYVFCVRKQSKYRRSQLNAFHSNINVVLCFLVSSSWGQAPTINNAWLHVHSFIQRTFQSIKAVFASFLVNNLCTSTGRLKY